MITARIDLTDSETETLRMLADRTGQTPEELIRTAICRFLTECSETSRPDALRQARGLWKDRNDLPQLNELRNEFDRYRAEIDNNG